jgi:hypothetical protein
MLLTKPVASVLVSEVGVDWLKHAFITKFNHIRPTVYERYTDILCRDLSASQGSWVGRRSGRKVRPLLSNNQHMRVNLYPLSSSTLMLTSHRLSHDDSVSHLSH